jgi:hypothetical protein
MAAAGPARKALPAPKRSVTQEPNVVTAAKGRPALKVTVEGDLASTKHYKYSRKGLEELLGRPLDNICLPSVLEGKASSTCPTTERRGTGLTVSTTIAAAKTHGAPAASALTSSRHATGPRVLGGRPGSRDLPRSTKPSSRPPRRALRCRPALAASTHGSVAPIPSSDPQASPR